MRLTILLIPMVLIGCLPARLVPHDFTIEKNNLEAFIELDSVTISLINLKAKGDHYVFGLEVQNKSSTPIFLDIQKMKKFAHQDSYRALDGNILFPEVTSVMTREQVNALFRAKKKEGEAAAFLLFLVGAAISTYDAIQDDKDWKKSEWTAKDQHTSDARDLITATTLIATDLLADAALHSSHAAQTELHYLPDELFDKEIIYPKEVYYGKVFFENYGEIRKHHRITFPIEDKRLHFDFRRANGAERRFLNGGNR